jgi:hypothetical protein
MASTAVRSTNGTANGDVGIVGTHVGIVGTPADTLVGIELKT